MQEKEAVKVAYFSMEIALDPSIPTYSGGLGILAGDTLRSAADLGVPMTAVTLVYRKGYFRQHLDERGNQSEEPDPWRPEEVLTRTEPLVTVSIEGRSVSVRAWDFRVRGVSGHEVPIYLLDTDLPENTPWDRTLTDSLYGGDGRYRLCQEVVLGIGGVEMLERLGYGGIQSYHMNEGHSALLALALLERRLGNPHLGTATEQDLDAVRRQCIFTTHTPVPAGHDQFPKDLVRQILGPERTAALEGSGCFTDGTLNMTYVALKCSHYINGVAMHHPEVSRGMFPNYPIRAITNGVHAVTWTCPAFRDLYDRHFPEWRRDNLYLRYAVGIRLDEIRAAHAMAKRTLLEEIQNKTGVQLEESVMTIGFARRATAYKRASLLFTDLDRLRRIADRVGPFQIVLGGKAHFQDELGKAMIRRVFEAAALLKDKIRIVYVENYDIHWGQLLTSGADIWLNTPQRPNEASGTSGMKAALNGVPSLSVPDGWWFEGHVEGVTGWDIGQEEIPESPAQEVADLYNKLEQTILPMFYGCPEAYTQVMRSTIALNGSFFNTQRMVSQYLLNAFREEPPLTAPQVLIELRRSQELMRESLAKPS
jgi:starch phosphorylase